MQERYLGDVHDYFKFLFLKFLSINLKMKIGLNWYLVRPEDIGTKEVEKNDGEKRSFLNKHELRNYDTAIIKEFEKLKFRKNRNINKFTENTHLNLYINFFNKFINLKDRKIWIEQSLNHFETEQIIFLDPDNGFSPQNQGKKSLKYILAEDCKTYLSHNKIIIFTQFQSFRKKTSSHLDNLLSNLLDSGLNTNTPIIRNRTGPNTFYITIKPTKLKINLGSIFKKYADMFQHVELIDKV